MTDPHVYPAGWGIKPVLFHLGALEIPSYSFFVLLGLVAGLTVFFREAKRQKDLGERSFFIIAGSLIGGMLGAKGLEWAINYPEILDRGVAADFLLNGKTIIGGLLGGMLGANIAKKLLGIKTKKGNLIAPGIALGIAVGRLGCFLHGCCYGKPTSLPWGVDFGDHVLRHPTQLYEGLFMLGMFFYLERIKVRPGLKPGELFKILMIAYFIFRFLIEFIRVEKAAFWGLTVFQVIALGVLAYLLKDNLRSAKTHDGK